MRETIVVKRKSGNGGNERERNEENMIMSFINTAHRLIYQFVMQALDKNQNR